MGEELSRGHNNRALFTEQDSSLEKEVSVESGEPMVPELQHVIDGVINSSSDFEANPVLSRSNEKWVLHLDRVEVSGGAHKGKQKTAIWLEHFEEPFTHMVLAAINDKVEVLELKEATENPETPIEFAGPSQSNQRLAALHLRDAAQALGIAIPPQELKLPD